MANVTKAIQSDKCWRCSSGERQSRYHLPVCQAPGLGAPNRRVAEERREGLQVETPVSANRLTALPGCESDSGCLGVPAGY